MKWILPIVAILGVDLAIGLGNAAHAATAAEILAWCRPDSPKHSATLCEGYIEAIARIAARTDRIEDNLGVACIPENMTAHQLSALVVEKLQPSPEVTNTDGFEAIAPILVKAFPCSP